MKLIKKGIAIALALSMICGLAISTVAAGEDVTLSAFKADGTAIGSDESVSVGDKVTVKMSVNKEASVFSARFRVWYDSSVFEFDQSTSSYTSAVTTAFKSETLIANPSSLNGATAEEQVKLDSGFRPVNLTVTNGTTDTAIPNGEWVSLSFTALKEASASQFEVQIRDIDSVTAGGDISENFTAGNVIVRVADDVVHVTNVILRRTSGTVNIGNTYTVRVSTIEPENATDKTVVWTSSDENIATVQSINETQATVTPISTGVVNITATVDGVSAVCVVTVTNLITQIEMMPTSATAIAGETLQLTAVLTPATPDNPTLDWTSSNKDAATVDANGLVTLIAAGKTTITASAKDGSGMSAACNVTVLAKPQGDGLYTIKMPADTTASVGESVSLPITIGTTDESVTTFNTVDMIFSYDAEKLSLASTELDDFTVTDNAGSVRVQGYGKDKELGTAFTLQFEVIARGDSTVTITQAKADISANATTENVANAEILDADTVITVASMCAINLPEGMSSEQGTQVESGTDYTFKVDDYDENYIYTVTAVSGEETVTVTDNGNGTYTIANVQGDITVSMTKAGKPASVTITSDDGIVITGETGENAAAYGTDYTFTIEKEEGFAYTVTAVIGGKEYAISAPDENGKYTIPGSDVTGDIAITITKTAVNSVNVTFEGTGKDDVLNPASTAIKGEAFTFTLDKKEGYEYTVKYAVGGVGDTTVTGDDDNNYTIAADKVTGDLLITITKAKVYKVTFEGNGADRVLEDLPMTVEEGADCEFTVYQHQIYTFTVTASIDGGETTILTPLNNYSGPTQMTGSIKYKVEGVTGDLTITINYIGDTDKLNIEIVEYVNTNAKTVYLLMIQPKTNRVVLDQFDGVNLFRDSSNKYLDYFVNKYNCRNQVFMLPIFVDKGETLTVEELLPKLTFGNLPTDLRKTNDVNGSQIVDINDAQLVYDIYNGKYNDFTTVSMQKFLNADVNCDMKVNVQDAVAVVAAIP